LIVLTRHTGLVLLTSVELFDTRRCYSILKTVRCKHTFFQKLPYFSQSNIVLDPPFSYIDSFLTRDRVHLPIHLKGVLLQNDVPVTLKA
jgi:hypothetical protein